MRKHEIHTLSKKAGFSSMKEELTKEVEHFLDKKVNEGYEIVNISFTYGGFKTLMQQGQLIL